MDNESADYFSDSPPESSSKSSEKKKTDSAQTALADKALFPEDVKPGYRCEIEVVAVHESEVEFKKLPHKKEDEARSEMTESASAPSEDDYA